LIVDLLMTAQYSETRSFERNIYVAIFAYFLLIFTNALN